MGLAAVLLIAAVIYIIHLNGGSVFGFVQEVVYYSVVLCMFVGIPLILLLGLAILIAGAAG